MSLTQPGCRPGPAPIDWATIRDWDERYYAHVFASAGEYVHQAVVRADGDFLELADGSMRKGTTQRDRTWMRGQTVCILYDPKRPRRNGIYPLRMSEIVESLSSASSGPSPNVSSITSSMSLSCSVELIRPFSF